MKPFTARAIVAELSLAALLGSVSGTSAVPISWDPKATNGNFGQALDSSVGKFSSGQGAGILYEDLNVAAGTGANISFTGDLTVDITSFLTASGGTISSGINSGWQLFLTIYATGTGTWTGSTFNATFDGTSAEAMWGVEGNQTTFADPTRHDSTGLNNFAAFNVTGPTVSSGMATCYSGTPVSPTPNCIRVADAPAGTVGGDLQISAGSGTGNFTENFDLVSLLNPLNAAEGEGTSGGLIDEPNDFDFGFGILSGSLLGSQTNDSVEDSPLDFFSGSCSAGTCTEAGVPINWAATAIPEPDTLALFGTGLAAIGLLSRRRRSRFPNF